MPKANTNKNAKYFIVCPPWSRTADHVLFSRVPTCFVARPLPKGETESFAWQCISSPTTALIEIQDIDIVVIVVSVAVSVGGWSRIRCGWRRMRCVVRRATKTDSSQWQDGL